MFPTKEAVISSPMDPTQKQIPISKDVSQPMTDSTESLVIVTTRFGLYTAGLLGGFALLPHMVIHGDILVFKEGGIVEWVQFGLLGLACGWMLVGSLLLPRFKAMCCIVALAIGMAMIRELDSLLNNSIPVLGWKLPCGLILAVLLIIAWRARRAFLPQLRTFTACRGFAIIWAGFAVAVPFAQLVGHGNFLQIIMGDDYVRDYKRVIEELGEVFGYLLVVIGSVESTLQMAVVRPQAARSPVPSGHAASVRDGSEAL